MTSKYRYISTAILAIGLVISIWFLICNLQTIKPAPYAFAVCGVIGLNLTLKIFSNNFILAIKRRAVQIAKLRYFVIVALLAITFVGILARLFFYFRFSYSPISDPVTFYDSAITLANGGSLQGNVYIALFPYLEAYNNILSLAIRIISNPWLATILLNTVLDLLGALIMFILVKKVVKPSSKLPVLAFGLWMLSPLNIIFSVLSLPIVVVNFFVVLTMLVSYLLIQQITNLKRRNTLILSVALGLILGIGNCFRPIFVVAIIALIIVYSILILTTSRSIRFLKLFAGSASILLVIFFGIQRLNVEFVSSQIGLNAASSPAGWSMYVGSSYGTFGQWRQYHNNEMSVICRDSLPEGNFDECHSQLQHLATLRYKDLGVVDLTRLFVHKLYHQASQQNYFYNAEQSITGYSISRTAKIINGTMAIYMAILFLLSAIFLYSLAKKSTIRLVVSPIILFATLLLIGWFVSFMFVESAPRYSSVVYPIFILLAVVGLSQGSSRGKGVLK